MVRLARFLACSAPDVNARFLKRGLFGKVDNDKCNKINEKVCGKKTARASFSGKWRRRLCGEVRHYGPGDGGRVQTACAVGRARLGGSLRGYGALSPL